MMQRASAVAMVLLLLGACGEDEPAPAPIVEAPLEVPEPPKRPVPPHMQKLDDLGRIRVASDRIYGFVVPMGLRVVSEAGGMRVFDLIAPADRLVEVYTHRDYSVTREPRGFLVQHTRRTLEGQPKGLYDGATLRILVKAKNRALLRISAPPKPSNRLNALNPPGVDDGGTAASPKAPPAGEDAVAITPKPPTAPPPAHTEPAVPRPDLLVPKDPGHVDASPAIRQWISEHPGRAFQD